MPTLAAGLAGDPPAGLAGGPAPAAELGDDLLAAADGDVIDPAAAEADPLGGGCHQDVALAHRDDEADVSPAATVTGPRLLQAQANALSASSAPSRAR